MSADGLCRRLDLPAAAYQPQQVNPCPNVNVCLGLIGFLESLGGIVVVPMYPERSSDHMLPSNANDGLSIDHVSDFDQFLHADIRPKRYNYSSICSKVTLIL